MTIRRLHLPLLILSTLLMFAFLPQGTIVVTPGRQPANDIAESVEAPITGGVSPSFAYRMGPPPPPPGCGVESVIPAETPLTPPPKTPPPAKTTARPHGKFHRLIIEAANRHQLDPALIKAVIKAESGYNARAVSKKGAMGLMQLMPLTAKALGVVDSLDPEHNINGGTKYLRQLMDRFDGNVRLALAAYNAGSKRVRQYRGVPPFKATRYYIKKVLAYYQVYKKQMEKPVDSA